MQFSARLRHGGTGRPLHGAFFAASIHPPSPLQRSIDFKTLHVLVVVSARNKSATGVLALPYAFSECPPSGISPGRR